MNNRGSRNVMSNYRRRQERIERLLPVLWIGIALLVIGGGYLIYQFLLPGAPSPTPNITETPTATESIAQSTSTATNPAATATSPAVEQIETPTPNEAPPTTGVITYTVREGDTLFSIAAQFGVGLTTLSALNPQVTPEFLNVGDQLSIPAQEDNLPGGAPGSTGAQSVTEYQVEAGDTLAKIAERFGSTVDAIVRENDLESPNQIREGQTLRIPAVASASPSTAPEQPNPTSETAAPPTPQG